MLHIFSHICCNNSIATSVFMLQVASDLSRCCICFHTYVVSVCFRCFICFRRMLHSSVSCCTCFVLFEESRGSRECDAASRWPADVARGALGASGRGHDGVVVRLWGVGRMDEDGVS